MARVEIERPPGGIVTCWLDNAERRNALDDAMLATLADVLEQASAAGVRAVVIRGRGATFCSGRDLRELDASGDDSTAALTARIVPVQRLARAVQACAVPTLAVVEGKAVGLGVALATWCDLALADEGASFMIPEARVGVAPSFTAVSLMRVIGRAAALDLCITGRSVRAPEALALGLVRRVHAPGQLDQGLRTLLGELVAASPQAISATRELLASIAGLPFEQALERAVDTAVASMRSTDALAGMQAFRTRSKPPWTLNPQAVQP